MTGERVPVNPEEGPLDLPFGPLDLEQFCKLRWRALAAIDSEAYDELCRRFPRYNIERLRHELRVAEAKLRRARWQRRKLQLKEFLSPLTDRMERITARMEGRDPS